MLARDCDAARELAAAFGDDAFGDDARKASRKTITARFFRCRIRARSQEAQNRHFVTAQSAACTTAKWEPSIVRPVA